MKTFLLGAINKVLSMFGVKLIRMRKMLSTDFRDIFLNDVPRNEIINLSSITALSENIHGMITGRAGEELFSLAYMQPIVGNVVEIGSFQGKSTFFLGSAVKLSGNGVMFAIDHFKGNLGKEKFYRVGRDDLSDLEQGFRNNIKRAHLENTVTLLNKPNIEAVKEIQNDSVRFLFIDGDHTAAGVAKDLELFKCKLKRGAIIAFDDYCQSFPGVIDLANQFIASESVARKYMIEKTLIVELAT